jgi:ribonuclease R
MSGQPNQLFLARATRDGGILVLERCFDPTPANRIPLDDGESVGEGDYLIAESVRSGSQGIAARIRERLAEGGTALAVVYALAVRHRLDPVFPARVMADTGSLLEDPGIDDPSLEDLRALPFCTIDGPATRDLDQALHVARAQGGYRLHYALADASWFVAQGSALFEAALARSSSFYLPGLVIPMLPRPLSEGIVSLNPGVDRRALVMVMDIDGDGTVVSRAWVRARVRSRAKLAFDEVPRLLAGASGRSGTDPGLLASLSAFRALGETLAERRDREGVVRYRRDEVDMTLGPEGRTLVPIRIVADPSERWNEEISVLCNVEGARFLLDGDRPDDAIEPIYRVHPAPPPERLDELERCIAAMVLMHEMDPHVWGWRRDAGESLAAYLRRLPKEGAAGRLAAVIHRQAVVTNLRSTFAAEPAPHAGVGAEVYGRFTAPMREMVGIYLHQETIEKLEGLAPSGSADHRNLRRRVIDGANRARELQSRLVKEVNRAAMDALWTADLALAEAERPRRRATVMGLRGNRLYCLLDIPPLEVKVYSDDIAETAGEPVETDPDGTSLRARSDGRVLVRLGDTGYLYVRRLDTRRDRWVLGVRADG